MMKPFEARLVCIAVTALLVAGCDQNTDKTAATKNDAKAETKSGGKAQPEGDAKAAAGKAGDAGAAPKTGDAGAAPKAGDPTAERTDAAGAEPSAAANKFRKGQVAPKDMSPEDVRAYAEAQGDPMKGEFSLDQALEGDESLAEGQPGGKLRAIFDTTMGKFECELYEDKAPVTVANFVGLARGTRPSYDQAEDTWGNKKFYDGVIFHRVIKGFMIQTGDPSGSGTGGPGYVIVDETDNGLKHTKPGMLSMANRGPNTGSSQFFVTVAKTPHLDGKHTVFGECDPKVALEISKVKVSPDVNRPYEPVKINSVEIVRK